MGIGNALALLFCFVQGTFHLMKLDPTNYFVSFVPVNLNLLSVLAVNIISFVVIMLLLLIPCAFISRVDPADTVRVR
jgi:lipoprotein-releasing system permease protein